MKIGKMITAFSVSIMLMFNMAAAVIPVSAETGNLKTYTHDGYTVKYSVTGEWTGNQSVQVTVTNTGEEAISNWAMGYDAHGEISGLWDAKVYGQQDTEYILSGVNHNSEIKPGQSVSFGYILKGDDFKFPQDIKNRAERVDITDGYNVYFNVKGDYGDTYSAEMIIENTSDTDIMAWQLGFEGNVTIDNLWNGQLIENNNSSFKVKGVENNSTIAAGKSVSFSFSGKKNNSEIPIVTQTEGTTVIVTETTAPVTEEIASETTSETTVATTEAVTSSETLELQELENFLGTAAVTLASDTEAETPAETTVPVTTVSDIVPEMAMEPVSANSDIMFCNYKLTGVVIPMEFDFEVGPEVDSDNDGLPDCIEMEIGSDRYVPDTDGDGLPDGYEYFTLGTDPVKADTDDNGISDADEDFGEDKLSNLEEYELETDPFSKDTDYDGLTDYDEVNIHNTNPLKYDSDVDKVSDGDEITLGLDPNNPSTHGYPDSEYTTEQTLDENSSSLGFINNDEDNPYKVTVDITAAGVADNCLSAGESGYSYSILQNEAVLGVVPEFTYSEGLKVEDVVISFNLNDSAVTDRIGVYEDDAAFDDVNRFVIFRYFEDSNVLLPINTYYDEAENKVYTNVDELGTYCLIDMEKWVYDIESAPAGNYCENYEPNEPANIVFCIDTRSIINAQDFESVKNDIKTVTEDAFERYTNIKVYVYYQQFGSDFRVTNKLLNDSKTGNNYFTSYEEAASVLDGLKTYIIQSNFWAYDFVEATNYMIDTCDENIIAMYHITANDRVMGSVNEAKKLTQTVLNSKCINEPEKNRIYVSLLCPFSNEKINPNSYAAKLAEISGGITYSAADDVEELEVMTMNLKAENTNNKQERSNANSSMVGNIVEILGEGNKGIYVIITFTGAVKSVKFESPLKPNETYEDDELIPDFDEDGISNWDEVNLEFIADYAGEKVKNSKYTIKNGDLPTVSYFVEEYKEKTYMSDVIGFITRDAYSKGLYKARVLPIKSDPTNPDSDGDGIVDGIKFFNSDTYTEELNKGNGDRYKKTEFNDPNPLKYNYLWEWPVVSANAVEEVNGELKSKLDSNGNKLVFKDEFKLTRLQASFKDNRAHKAIDISIGGNGTYYVIAAFDGKVTYTYEDCNHISSANRNSKDYGKCHCNFCGNGYGGYGNCIEITSNINGFEYKALYSHLQKNSLLVKEGEVKAGEIIAIVGSSGNSFGPHLDFTIYSGKSTSKTCYDPILFNDMYVSGAYYKDGDGRMTSYKNMLMNIPQNIQNLCSDINCNDCKEYYKAILHKYYSRLW